MSKSLDQPCVFCEEEPVQGGVWTFHELIPLCKECLRLSMAYDFVLDNVRKQRYSESELRESAQYVLDKLEARLKTDTESFKAELAEAGLKI